MKSILHLKLKDFMAETDNRKKERLADRLKDMMEVSPVLYRNVNKEEVKPMVMIAIDKYVYNSCAMNRCHLLHALGNMGLW